MIPKAYPKAPTLVLVITNDSAVFLKDGIGSAWEMFGGRATEVKKLVAKLDTAARDDGSKLCQVSFGIISSRFGYVPADYTIMAYPPEEVMDSEEDYKRVQEAKDYIGKIRYTSKMFDRIVVCVPKGIMRMIMDADALPDGRVIAITSPELKDECQKRDWMFLERRGARVGNENVEAIMREIYAISPVDPDKKVARTLYGRPRRPSRSRGGGASSRTRRSTFRPPPRPGGPCGRARLLAPG